MRIIILAAGRGTRMKSDQAKVLALLAGRPLIHYVLDAVADAQIDPKPIVVIGYQSAQVREALKDYTVEFVEQTEQKGTGHALAVCAGAVDPAESILVLYGDQPLVTGTTIGALADEHDAGGKAVTMMTYTVPDFDVFGGAFAHFGRIIRDPAGNVLAIREYKDASEAERAVREVNPAYYAFSGPWLWQNIKKLGTQNAQKEYYLTDLIAMAIEQGAGVQTIAGEQLAEAIGVNTAEQLTQAAQLINHPPS